MHICNTPVATIPLPPSANALWTLINGMRVKTKVYRGWKRDAAWQLKLQLTGLPADRPVGVRLETGMSRRRDLDNILKPCLDALVASGVIGDDRWIDRVIAVRSPHAPEDMVTVRIWLDTPSAADMVSVRQHGEEP